MTDRALRRAILVLGLLGLAIAAYLTYIHYRKIDAICEIAHGCVKVQTSEWSELAGVPVAVLGLAGYVGIVASVFVPGEAGLIAGAGQSLLGFGFSAYLTYREVFTIEAICIWCIGSAIILTVLAALTTIRLLRVEQRASTTPT
jgi:uncharacterized membrane protein